MNQENPAEQPNKPLLEWVQVTYHFRPKAERVLLRNQFSDAKEKFFKHITNTEENISFLKANGCSDTDIELMKKGKGVPWLDVHHKHPLAVGGDNSFDNLILVETSQRNTTSFHTLWHQYFDAMVMRHNDGRLLDVGQSMPINIAKPTGFFLSKEMLQQAYMQPDSPKAPEPQLQAFINTLHSVWKHSAKRKPVPNKRFFMFHQDNQRGCA